MSRKEKKNSKNGHDSNNGYNQCHFPEKMIGHFKLSSNGASAIPTPVASVSSTPLPFHRKCLDLRPISNLTYHQFVPTAPLAHPQQIMNNLNTESSLVGKRPMQMFLNDIQPLRLPSYKNVFGSNQILNQPNTAPLMFFSSKPLYLKRPEALVQQPQLNQISQARPVNYIVPHNNDKSAFAPLEMLSELVTNQL